MPEKLKKVPSGRGEPDGVSFFEVHQAGLPQFPEHPLAGGAAVRCPREGLALQQGQFAEDVPLPGGHEGF